MPGHHARPPEWLWLPHSLLLKGEGATRPIGHASMSGDWQTVSSDFKLQNSLQPPRHQHHTELPLGAICKRCHKRHHKSPAVINTAGAPGCTAGPPQCLQKHSSGSAPVPPLAQTRARPQACPKQHARPMQSHTACPLVPGASVIPLAGMNPYLHACCAHDMQTPQKNGRSHGIAVKLCCCHCAPCAHAHGHLQ